MQRHLLNLISLSFLLLVCSSLAFSQPPPPKTSTKAKEPAVTPLGVIKGQVTTDDGRVLGNTVVMARAINGPSSMKTAQVDTEGRFVLQDVPAAVYFIFATAPGYIDESLTTGDLNQIPRHLVGSEIKIRLVKGGVITGTVTNSKGEGLVGLPVRASAALGSGSVLMGQGAGMGVTETDDRGVYRIFGLPPGQYTVDAGGGGQLARFVTTGFELDTPTFYPSSTYDTAVPVTARSGEEATGIDIRYKGSEGHSLSGKVVGNVDSTVPALSVFLAYAGTTTSVSTTIVSTTDANRAYSFDGLADGDYDVSAISLSSPTDNATATSRRVTIRGTDVTGFELVMAPLATISGSLKLEPIAPEKKCDERGSQLLEIMLEMPRDDAKNRKNQLLPAVLSMFSASLNVGGDFSVRNLEAGSYRPQVKLPTEAWYVRSITVPAGSSVQPAVQATGEVAGPPSEASGASRPSPSANWPGIINVKAGARINGVAIIVGQDAAGVRGRVVMPGKNLVPPNLRVHLVPAEAAEAQTVLHYFETAVEREGNFALTNLPPGRYFAIPRISPPPAAEEKRRPLALDATARATLRREAEALNNLLELKPCQRAADVSVPFKVSQ